MLYYTHKHLYTHSCKIDRKEKLSRNKTKKKQETKTERQTSWNSERSEVGRRRQRYGTRERENVKTTKLKKKSWEGIAFHKKFIEMTRILRESSSNIFNTFGFGAARVQSRHHTFCMRSSRLWNFRLETSCVCVYALCSMMSTSQVSTGHTYLLNPFRCVRFVFFSLFLPLFLLLLLLVSSHDHL